MQIGTNLVKQAISRYNEEKYAYKDMEYETEMEIEAVNIRFGEFLARKFGFEIIRKLSDRLILRKE